MKPFLSACLIALSLSNVSFAIEAAPKNCKVTYNGIDSDSDNKSEEFLDAIVISELIDKGYTVSDSADATYTLEASYTTENNEKKFGFASCEVSLKLTSLVDNDDENTLAMIAKSKKQFKFAEDKEANCVRKLKRAASNLPFCI